MDWDKLRVFYNVAESGNFTKAAQKLDVSQSAVSRQISSLEDNLDTPLFHRHARGLILTEQGEMLFKTTREVFSELTMAEMQIRDNTAETSGRLRVISTVSFGNSLLADVVPDFLRKYPNIRLDVTVDDNPVNFSLHEADVSITSCFEEEGDQVFQELMKHQPRIYASRDYLLRHGVPLTPQQLDRHRLIGFGKGSPRPTTDPNWLLSYGIGKGAPRKPSMYLNSLYGIGRALEGGAGIAMLPTYVAKQCNNLVQILPEAETPEVTIYFSYPSQLSQSKRIIALYNFLTKKVREYNP